MKIITTLLALALISAGLYYAYARYSAYYLEDGAYMTTPSFKSDKVSRLESLGDDSRVYEFTPRTASYKQCIYVADSRGPALDCFDKK